MTTQFAIQDLHLSDHIVSTHPLQHRPFILINHGTHLRLIVMVEESDTTAQQEQEQEKTQEQDHQSVMMRDDNENENDQDRTEQHPHHHRFPSSTSSTFLVRIPGIQSSIVGIVELPPSPPSASTTTTTTTTTSSTTTTITAIHLLLIEATGVVTEVEFIPTVMSTDSTTTTIVATNLSHYEPHHSDQPTEVSNAIMNSLLLSKNQYRNDLYSATVAVSPTIWSSSSSSSSSNDDNNNNINNDNNHDIINSDENGNTHLHHQNEYIWFAVYFASTLQEVTGNHGLVHVYVYSTERRRVLANSLVHFPTSVKNLCIMSSSSSSSELSKKVHLQMISHTSNRTFFNVDLEINSRTETIVPAKIVKTKKGKSAATTSRNTKNDDDDDYTNNNFVGGIISSKDVITSAFISESSEMIPITTLRLINNSENDDEAHQQRRLVVFLNADKSNAFFYLISSSSTCERKLLMDQLHVKGGGSSGISSTTNIFGPIVAVYWSDERTTTAADKNNNNNNTTGNNTHSNNNIINVFLLRTSGCVTVVEVNLASSSKRAEMDLVSKTHESFDGRALFSEKLIMNSSSNTSATQQQQQNRSVIQLFRSRPSDTRQVLHQHQRHQRDNDPKNNSSSMRSYEGIFNCLVSTDNSIDLFHFSQYSTIFVPAPPKTGQPSSSPTSSSPTSSSSASPPLPQQNTHHHHRRSTTTTRTGKAKISISPISITNNNNNHKNNSIKFFGRPTASTFCPATGEVILANREGAFRRLALGKENNINNNDTPTVLLAAEFKKDEICSKTHQNDDDDDDDSHLVLQNLFKRIEIQDNNNYDVITTPTVRVFDRSPTSCFLFIRDLDEEENITTTTTMMRLFVLDTEKGTLEEQELDDVSSVASSASSTNSEQQRQQQRPTPCLEVLDIAEVKQNEQFAMISRDNNNSVLYLHKLMINSNYKDNSTIIRHQLTAEKILLEDYDDCNNINNIIVKLFSNHNNDQHLSLCIANKETNELRLFELSCEGGKDSNNPTTRAIQKSNLILMKPGTATIHQVLFLPPPSHSQKKNNGCKISSSCCEHRLLVRTDNQILLVKNNNNKNSDEDLMTSVVLYDKLSPNSHKMILIPTEATPTVNNNKITNQVLLASNTGLTTQNFIFSFDEVNDDIIRSRVVNNKIGLSMYRREDLLTMSSSWRVMMEYPDDSSHLDDSSSPVSLRIYSSSIETTTTNHNNNNSSDHHQQTQPFLSSSSTVIVHDEPYKCRINKCSSPITVTSMTSTNRYLFASVFWTHEEVEENEESSVTSRFFPTASSSRPMRSRQETGILVFDLFKSFSSSNNNVLEYLPLNNNTTSRSSSTMLLRSFFFCTCSCSTLSSKGAVVGEAPSGRKDSDDDNDDDDEQFTIFGTSDGELIVCKKFLISSENTNNHNNDNKSVSSVIKIVSRNFLPSSASSSSTVAITAITPSKTDASLVFVALSDNTVCAVRLERNHLIKNFDQQQQTTTITKLNIVAQSNRTQHQQIKDIISIDSMRVDAFGGGEAILLGSLSSGVVCVFYKDKGAAGGENKNKNSTDLPTTIAHERTLQARYQQLHQSSSSSFFTVLCADPTPNHLLKVVFAGKNCQHAEGDSLNFLTFDAFRNVSWSRTPERKKKKEIAPTSGSHDDQQQQQDEGVGRSSKNAKKGGKNQNNNDDDNDEDDEFFTSPSRNMMMGQHQSSSSSTTQQTKHGSSTSNNNNNNHTSSSSSPSQQQQSSGTGAASAGGSSPTTIMRSSNSEQKQPTHLETPSTIWGGGCKLSRYVSNVLDCSSSICNNNNIMLVPSVIAKSNNPDEQKHQKLDWDIDVGRGEGGGATSSSSNQFAKSQGIRELFSSSSRNQEVLLLQDKNFFKNSFMNHEQKIIVSATGAVSLLYSVPKDWFDILSIIQKSLQEFLLVESDGLDVVALQSTNEDDSHQQQTQGVVVPPSSSSVSSFSNMAFLSPYRRMPNTSFLNLSSSSSSFRCCSSWKMESGISRLMIKNKNCSDSDSGSKPFSSSSFTALVDKIKKDLSVDFPSLLQAEEENMDADADYMKLEEIFERLNRPIWL